MCFVCAFRKYSLVFGQASVVRDRFAVSQGHFIHVMGFYFCGCVSSPCVSRRALLLECYEPLALLSVGEFCAAHGEPGDRVKTAERIEEAQRPRVPLVDGLSPRAHDPPPSSFSRRRKQDMTACFENWNHAKSIR